MLFRSRGTICKWGLNFGSGGGKHVSRLAPEKMEDWYCVFHAQVSEGVQLYSNNSAVVFNFLSYQTRESHILTFLPFLGNQNGT